MRRRSLDMVQQQEHSLQEVQWQLSKLHLILCLSDRG